MAWVETLEEFLEGLNRWGDGIRYPHDAEWQVFFEKKKVNKNKVEIYSCYHPSTNEQFTEKQAIEFLSEVFLNYGEAGWKRWPAYEKKTGIMHVSPVFEKVINRTDFPPNRPELDNIYIKLRINKDFEHKGVTADKFEIVSFHPERVK